MVNTTGTITIQAGAVRLECAAICFDLDGVLVDSVAQIDEAVDRWATSRRIPLRGLREASRSLKDIEFVKLAAPSLDPHREAAHIQMLELELAHLARPLPGSVQAYNAVPEEQRAIVTSGSRPIVERRIAAIGITNPDVLVAAEDVERGKPHRQPYARAVAQMGILPSEAVAFEDSLAGARSAHDAGLRVIRVGGTTPSPAGLFVAEVPSLAAVAIHQPLLRSA